MSSGNQFMGDIGDLIAEEVKSFYRRWDKISAMAMFGYMFT